MTVDSIRFKIGDSVRFVNGQVAKVVDITGKNEQGLCVEFNKAVASDTKENNPAYSTSWFYSYDGKIVGCTNHIVKVVKKGEL